MTLQRFKVRIAGGAALIPVLLAMAVQAVAQTCADDPVFGVHKENLDITKKQAADYKPGARNYYVRDFNDSENIYLKAALSPARRKAWFERWKDPNFPKCMNPELDQLAAVAKKTLPSYKPTGFTVRNAGEEQLLRSAVNDIANAKVISSGMDAATWNIEKRSNGLPNARYKHGMIYARYPSLDDGYCRIIHVNIVQDYAGGGTYADSKARFIKSEFAGCP
jgi:hypothetical protein